MNPLVAKLLAAVVVLAAAFFLGGYLGYNYATGQTAKKEAKAEVKAADNAQKIEDQNATSVLPVIKLVKETQWRTKIIVQKIPEIQYVKVPAPVTQCPAAITHADGVLIDAAAGNVDPPAGSIPDGAPYPAQDVTSSVIENYGSCNAIAARLSGLQDYVRRTITNTRLLCPQ